MRSLVAERDALSKKVALLVDAARTGEAAAQGAPVEKSQTAPVTNSRKRCSHQRCVMELEQSKEKVKRSKNRLRQMESLLPQLGRIWQQVNDGVRELKRSRESDPIANHLGHVLTDLRDALRSTRGLLDTVQTTSDSQEELIQKLYKTLTETGSSS